MKLNTYPYSLRFKFPFRISHGERTATDVVYLQIEHGGFIAWGEAALPPYRADTLQTVLDFIHAFSNRMKLEPPDLWMAELQKQNTCMPGKAALDMALWSLLTQMKGVPLTEFLNIRNSSFPLATYTFGISDAAEVKQKMEVVQDCGIEIFKLKLNGQDDERMVQQLQQLSDKPFAVDVNGAWQDATEALKKLEWLADCGCLLAEQPLPVYLNEEMKTVKARSPIPIYADESCQREEDIIALADKFDGINIKLMKCGGLTEALLMISRARSLQLKILIGCMSESSVGCTAAAQLSPLADYADLDGPYLIANDPFEGMKIEKGRIQIHPLRQVYPFT